MKLIAFLLAILLMLTPTAAAAPPGEANVPIIMYHSLYERPTNEWNIFPAAFEEDLRYLRENGYTTVFISDLIDFVREGAPLPPRPIVLTFDDGYYNNFSQGMPMLEAYDARIVLSVIGSSTDHWSEHQDETDERYGHLTWPQIAEMVASGRVELANHTQDLHKTKDGRKGCKMKTGEDFAAYSALLSADIGTLQNTIEQVTGARPQCFTYPFGAHCSKADEVLRELGFLVTLSCASGMNTLRAGDESTLWKLHRNNRTPDQSVEAILAKLLKGNGQLTVDS